MKIIRYLIIKIGYEVLSLLYFLVRWFVVAVILTYSLRWLGFGEGTSRVVNTIWFILIGLWSAAGYGYNKKQMLAESRADEASDLWAHLAQPQNEGHSTPKEEQDAAPLGKREQAIQKVMAEHGLSREEVEARINPYGL